MADVVLDEDVRKVLLRSTMSADLVRLPAGQLKRKLYERVAKALKLAGGRWHRGRNGFLFADDPRELLEVALADGKVLDQKKRLQSFYTPPALADEIVGLANVRGHRVLEPSAGHGSLVDACLQHGAMFVRCFEVDPKCRASLVGRKRDVEIADFLAVEPYDKFMRVVMNPPFSGGQAVKHLAQAKRWLDRRGTLLCVLPDVDNDKVDALGAVVVRRFAGGAFADSGTNVPTRLVRICG